VSSIHRVPLVLAKDVRTAVVQYSVVQHVNELQSIQNMQLMIDMEAMDNILLLTL